MGLFDTVVCKYPLPGVVAESPSFQTKDLECYLRDYIITENGRLLLHDGEWEDVPEEKKGAFGLPLFQHKEGTWSWVDQNYHGVFSMYGASGEFDVMFTNGTLSAVQPAKHGGGK